MNPACSDPASQHPFTPGSVPPLPTEGRGNLWRRTTGLVASFHVLALLTLCLAGQPLRAADPLTETFQKGLLEEEAHRDLPAAIAAYESVVKQIDDQRRFAATSVFRLGECYRKLGRTNDAVVQFRRIVREFPGEDTLVNLSRQNLVGLGIRGSSAQPSPGGEPPGTARVADTGDVPAQRAAIEREIKLAENQLATVKRKMEAGAAGTDDAYKAEREILKLQRELAALPSDPAPANTSADLDQAAKIDAQLAEIRTLNSQDRHLAIQQVFPSERLTELQHKKVAIFDRINALSSTSKTNANAADDDALKHQAEQALEEIDQEMQNILRSQELKAQLLRAPGKAGK